MPKKNAGPYTTVSIRFPEDHYIWIDAMAKRANRSFNQQVIFMVEIYYRMLMEDKIPSELVLYIEKGKGKDNG
jgi:hypothetical protein